MYQLINNKFGVSSAAKRLLDNAFIPFDPANTDYQQFKADVLANAELQDADGNVMTQEEVDTFINELP
jgi:hypothetical protein